VKFTKLSLAQKLWLFFAAVMALIGYMGYTFYSEKYVAYAEESERLKIHVKQKRAQLRQILAQKQRIKDLEAEIESAEGEFARLKEMFPDEEIIAKRMLDLTAVTRRSLTTPTKFAPLSTETKEFYQENHYALTIHSSFHALGMLFGEVANFKYPTSITKVSIERVSDLAKEVENAHDHGEQPKTVTATFQLTTFTSKR
jgi:type IV pilus assembly protein PilO